MGEKRRAFQQSANSEENREPAVEKVESDMAAYRRGEKIPGSRYRVLSDGHPRRYAVGRVQVEGQILRKPADVPASEDLWPFGRSGRRDDDDDDQLAGLHGQQIVRQLSLP